MKKYQKKSIQNHLWKLKHIFICLVFSFVLTLPLLPPSSAAVSIAASADSSDVLSAQPNAQSGQVVDILFLHDTHSHLDSFLTVQDGKDVVLGGFAHIKTLINQAKEHNPHTLILDAGDFSMGTLVQTVYHTDAPELRMLGALECDVTTLGNHEFDYRSEGLAGMMQAAAASGDTVPAMVLCNIDWEAMEAEGLTSQQQLLRDAFDTYGMKDYVMLEKGGIQIAVLGVFGEDSLACAPTCALKFKNASEAAAATVKKIKENENADLIVCVSHSGTNSDDSKSEDEILAKTVPEIDLIISGHTHTTLAAPIQHGSTYIVSCGEYGKNLGAISLLQNSDTGRWQLNSYDILPITPEITPDTAIREKIDLFMEKVDNSYLSQFGYTRTQILAQNNVTFSSLHDISFVHTEHNLGNLLADAFIYGVETADDFDGIPVDVALAPSGCIRDTFAVGDITVEDVFNAYSLGIGLDGVPGYPLISMYLTGAELKTGAEIDASMSDFMTTARLYLSGINFSFNPNRLILNKVTDCYLTDRTGARVEIQDDRLYRVVCDLYSGQMLGAVTDVSYGILSIQPKFADGTPIENIEDAIITSQGQELKAWAAIAGYLESLEDTDGDDIANVPVYYAQEQGRKVVENSKAIGDLLKKPNKYAVMIVVIILLAAAITITPLWLVIRLIRRLLRK